MLRYLLLLSTFITLSWGCLACSYGDIKVQTALFLNISKNTLTSVDVEWTLDPMFSQMVLGDFDLNRNGQFENSEKYEVYKAIEPMKEFAFFIRPKVNNHFIMLKELKNFTVLQQKGLVIYRFTIPINEPIYKSIHLQITYNADAAYNNAIVFHLNEKSVYLNPVDAGELTKKLTQIVNPRTNDSLLDITFHPRIIALSPALGGNTRNQYQSDFTQSLRTLTEKIHGALVEAQDHPSVQTIGAILFFSLLYGILHAAGPGHGKTLVASYFSTNERSYTRGVSIALLIAGTHVISAFTITMILYWFIHTMFSQTISDISLYTTKMSGMIILLIALYLTRQKWLYYQLKPKNMRFSTVPHTSSCGCHSCKKTAYSTDLMLILGAGIVPCPGTIIVFLFTTTMGMYLLGALSAIVMSLGMGLTIAITAAFGTALRHKGSAKGEKYLKTIDFLGVGIMLFAGIALVIS
ncbi:MAG: DUF1007 family protein [Sulfuricurvum sp.]|nr:DUF1007 family protein [Sulfuricurvum sp.]